MSSAESYPPDSIVGRIHHIWITDRGIDSWELAEETVKFLRQRMVNMIDPTMTGLEVKRTVLDLLATKGKDSK